MNRPRCFRKRQSFRFSSLFHLSAYVVQASICCCPSQAHKHAEREQKHDIFAAARAIAYGIGGDRGSLLPKVLREDVMNLKQRSKQQPQGPLIYDVRIVRI